MMTVLMVVVAFAAGVMLSDKVKVAYNAMVAKVKAKVEEKK